MKDYVVNRKNHPDDSDAFLLEEGEEVNLVCRDGRREAVRIGDVAADTIAGQDGGHSLRVRAGTLADGRWFLYREFDGGDDFMIFDDLAELGTFIWGDLVFEDATCASTLLALGMFRFNPEGDPTEPPE